MVDDLLAALDAVELAPPRARPPAGLEISDEWGTRRHDDRNSLGRILGVARGGDDGGNEDSESSSGGEITVADAEVDNETTEADSELQAGESDGEPLPLTLRRI